MEIDVASVHKQFPAAAEYVTSIYILLRDYGKVSQTRLAEWNEVSAPAVSQAIGRLRRLGLVRQKRYEHVTLTETGREFATKILRRHYLIEHLLVGMLGYPWDKADEEAKLLQTQISDDLTEHLYRKLGSPQTCPHGNPMPNAPIERKLLDALRLSDARESAVVRVLRITEEGEQIPSLLAFCHRNGIRPGARFRIDRTEDSGTMLRPERREPDSTSPAEIVVPDEMGRHIRYEPIDAGRGRGSSSR